MSSARFKHTGFTLLELLVVLTIVAVLSAIVLPLYTQFSERSYRVEAQADLMNCGQAMERWSAMNFTYLGAADEDGDEVSDGVASESDEGPLGLDLCRAASAEQARYDVFVEATATTYVLTAAPLAQGPMADDGEMTLDSAGNRTWDKDGNGSIATDEEDWNED